MNSFVSTSIKNIMFLTTCLSVWHPKRCKYWPKIFLCLGISLIYVLSLVCSRMELKAFVSFCGSTNKISLHPPSC